MKKLLFFIIIIAATFSTIPANAENWGNYRIMIDPGHGGTDPGATGPAYPSESVLALRCALELNNRLTSLGAPVVLTRSTDTFISLDARRSASISYDPYIFCSIHLNAFNSVAEGTETWYYWETGSSHALADRVHATLIAEMQRKNRGVKQNGWRVITGSASVPAILTEGLFVDNPTEWSLIQAEGSEGFNKWVNGHLYGFYDYLTRFSATITNPRNTQTTPAPQPDIKVNRTGWVFQCLKGNTVSTTFTVTGTDLTDAISVSSSNNALFAISDVNLSKDGGTFKVTFKPTESGDFKAVATLTSGSSKATVNLIGAALAPSLSATKNDIDVTGIEKTVKVGGTSSYTFHVSGTNLEGAISLNITGASKDLFTVQPATISKSEGSANVTVKYAPDKATPDGVNHNAKLTISTPNIDKAISITLKGTAIQASVNVTDASGNEIADNTHIYPTGTKVNEQKSKTFKIKGSNLEGKLKIDITGAAAKYFTIDGGLTEISKDDAEKGKSIKVLYKPTKATSEGKYHNANLRITSARMDTVRIKLRGTAAGPSVVINNSSNVEINEADMGSRRVGETGSKTLKIKGSTLQGDLALAIDGENAQYFTIDGNLATVTQAEAENGKSIKIKYRPESATESGTYHNATLKITSKLLEDIEIPLKGSAYKAGVTITNMSGENLSGGIDMAEKTVGQTGSKTINIIGHYLAGDITVSIEGDDVTHFSTEATTIAQDPGTGRFAIKYRPQAATEEGTRHQAVLKLTSHKMEDVIIPLTGTAKPGGTTSIETIGIDQTEVDCNAIYFTLQGQRIETDNLIPGVYIRIIDNKVTKVVIR